MSLIFILTLSNVIFLWMGGVCLFCLFKLYLSVFFVFHRKNLVLLNLINRYVTATSEKFLKS